ncbi:DUF1289 domain-containing protein [Pseudaeromonas paramecii]|uniref:DUF1289 domain-containing protein n=1 Tax=Pseudaeromonas paramecii TaxID=2138166 RepID=UPI0031E76C9F
MNKPSSPCRQRCELAGELCTGCGRTRHEIAHWSVLSETARQQVMAQLTGRLSTHACPACGEPSYCAMTAGEPAQTCWCMGLPAAPAMAEVRAAGLCLCRRCLAAQRASA